MPCTDGSSDWDRAFTAGREARKFESLLCGFITVLSNSNTLENWKSKVDWTEVGVTRKAFEEWWEEHQKADEKRREQEAFESNRELLKKLALAKLTPQERKALGV